MQLPTLSPRRLAGVAAIACAPNGRTAYAVNSGSGTVTPISIVTGRAGTAISVGSGPVAIAPTPEGARRPGQPGGATTITPQLSPRSAPGRARCSHLAGGGGLDRQTPRQAADPELPQGAPTGP